MNDPVLERAKGKFLIFVTIQIFLSQSRFVHIQVRHQWHLETEVWTSQETSEHATLQLPAHIMPVIPFTALLLYTICMRGCLLYHRRSSSSASPSGSRLRRRRHGSVRYTLAVDPAAGDDKKVWTTSMPWSICMTLGHISAWVQNLSLQTAAEYQQYANTRH